MTDTLRESEEQFEALFNYAPLGVYLVDNDLVIRKVNPVALPVFGDIPGGPVGRDFDEVIHILWTREYADEVVRIFRQTLETGESYVTPERAEHRSDRDAVEYYEWRVDRIPLPGRRYGVVCYFRDISAHVHARQEIEKAGELARVNEERQAFLLKLSDALRPLGDAMEVQTAALRVLGEHLAVNRAFFNEVDEEQDAYVIHRTYADGVAPLTGRFRLSDIRRTAELAGSGQIVVFDDVGADPRLSEVERASFTAMEVAAGVGVPLIKDGRWVAGLGVHQAIPRLWMPAEIDLIRETAERTWAAVERARAEAALRESEAKYRNLFETIPVGFGVIELIRDQSGDVVDWIVVELNPALERHTGLDRAVLVGRRIMDALPEGYDSQLAAMYSEVVESQASRQSLFFFSGVDRWLWITASPNEGDRINLVFEDVTERNLAEAAVQASEERQAFLLKLSDALRPLADPTEVQAAAVKVLGEHLGAVRAQYWEVEPDGEHVRSEGGYAKEGPRVSGRLRLNDFGVHVTEALAAGLTVAVSDVTADPLASEAVRAAYEVVGVRAYITVPLVKGGRLVALMGVHHTAARDWMTQEIALLEETAERTWAAVERARAEAVLRENESRLRTLFDSIDEGFMEVEVVMSADGRALDWRYLTLNAAFQRLTGLPDITGKLVSEFMPDLEPEWAERFAHVVNTGEAIRFEQPTQELDRWFEVYFVRVGDAGSRRVAAVYNDVTERKRAEAAMLENEARQAFLLKLSDALRPLADPDEIQFTAARLLGERMHVTRVFYFNVGPDGESFDLRRDYVDGVPSVAGRFSISQFDSHLAENWRSGRTVCSQDVRAQDVPLDQRYSPEQLAAFDATQARAWLGVPLVKAGRLVAVLGLSHAEPRAWANEEIALVEELAERTWAAVEQARAELALHESEGRYHELLDSIDEGFCVLEMITDDLGGFRDYRFLQTNPMFEAQTGLVDPIGRTALELAPGLERWWIDTYGQVATTGEARRFEHGSEALDRWFDVYAARVGEPGQLRVALLFRDISERKRAEGHRQLLIDELNHRVKNTLAVVQGLAQQTFRLGGDPQAARRAFDLRLVALATAHDVLTRENWVSADLAELVRTALAVHAGKDGRMVVEGPPVRLPPQTAVSVTLALHELATNAVKYGSLSIDTGSVEMRWTHADGRLSLTWLERDGPLVEPPTHRGFGTRLIERVFATELKATVEMEFPPAGLVCRINAQLPASCGAGSSNVRE